MKFQIKLLTLAATLAVTSTSFAAPVAGPGDDLGLLTQFPAQFLAYRLSDDEGRLAGPQIGEADAPAGVLFGHSYSFTLGTESAVIGSVGTFLGSPAFSSVSVVSNDSGLTAWSQNFNYADSGSFSTSSLAAGSYTLLVDVVYPAGPQGYSGSVYAAAPVPEPESLALLLAGLGVAGMVARRRTTRA